VVHATIKTVRKLKVLYLSWCVEERSKSLLTKKNKKSGRLSWPHWPKPPMAVTYSAPPRFITPANPRTITPLSHEEMDALISGDMAKIEAWVSNMDKNHAARLLHWLIKERW